MLIVVRHGRTVANASGLLQGRVDHPLDAVGEAQADAVAASLPRPVRVVSSPLLRARQTAERFGVPVEIDERWIELDYGSYDGTPLGDVPADVWARWRADPGFAPPGGESLTDLQHRVDAALDELHAAAAVADADGDVVVVSHVSPIKAAVAWALGVGPETSWRTHLDTASVTRIRLGSRPALVGFNDVAHLAGMS